MSVRLFLVRMAVRILTRQKRQRFERALREPQKCQQKVLSDILTLTELSRLPEQPTEYVSYPDNKSWTTESVKFYETTSGNSGKKKTIPYTRSLLQSFQNLFLLWIDDLMTVQRLKTGKLFMSISPRLESLGMSSDLDYLNPFFRWCMSSFIVARPSDFLAHDGHEFFKKIAIRLLNSPYLESISIWSPTYWISLTQFMQQNLQVLSLHIEASTIKKIQNQDWPAIWPNLKIISCWTDGSSLMSLRKLEEMFPQVSIQGKGLLATEAPMTIPWTSAAGCVPLWNEVYLEFIDKEGCLKPLHTIQAQQEVELVISTKGGLLRYRIGDIVRCTHFYRQSPVLKFVRRVGEVSDLVGEKLDAAILMDVFADLPRGKWLLVADGDHYVFVSDFKADFQDIDRRLCQAFHYGLARELKQLKAVRVKYFPDLTSKMISYYTARKIKVGDVKERLLWADPRILLFLESSKLSDSYL
ncbi:MAG: GH3 auxin-responsive promoter family protein [Bdellovibrionaceae bacterium]|nr:GH3 auxin-responsive promoter family protein [Pseudobdellovibrionaceae bacterium]